MTEEGDIIPSGPLKGKKIQFAPTTNVDFLTDIGEEFMLQIFGFEPGEYLITDYSSLSDLTDVDCSDLSCLHRKIQDVYELDVSDTGQGNLVEIFTRIHHGKYGSPS